MAEPTDEEIQERFAPAATGPFEADVLSELKSIMHLHSIPLEELWYKWESYSMKMGVDDMKLNIETANALKKDVQDGLERESRSKAHLQTKKIGGVTPRHGASGGDMFGILGGAAPKTPKVGSSSKLNGTANKRKFETPSMSRVKAEPASSPPDFKTPHRLVEQTGTPVSFHDRPNAGQAVEVFNDHLQVPDPPIAPYSQPRVKSIANSDYGALAYKTMAMKSSEASEILDDRIEEFMTLVQEHHKLEDSAFGSAASQSTNEIVAVGRIACDSLEGKLNAFSLVLETSRQAGAGLRIPLKVDSLPGFQFFPGQIVAVRGINTSGTEFTVSEVLTMPLLKGAASAPSRFDEYAQRLRGGPDAMDSDSDPPPLNILIGAGPYTSDDNLDFEPLHAICSQAADSYADALILAGPFLDVDHPLIATGDFDLPEEAMVEPDTISMSTVFKYLISPAFISLSAANPNIIIILVPSVKDVISSHVSWPQDRYRIPKKDLGLPKTVSIVGNPMTLSLNEISVGISSQDILSELRYAEVTGGRPTDNNLLARLPKYLIEQRHFFPLFPPVERESLPKTGTTDGRPTGAMIDTSFLKHGEMVNVRPDILIVPSALPVFAKVVEGVIVINPGYLSKRKAAGTFARLTVYPAKLSEEELSSNQMVGHKIFERGRVDILRI